MNIDDEIEQIEAELSEKANREFLAEQTIFDEIKTDAYKNLLEYDEDENNNRKILKRDLQAQALKRLEDSARTVKNFENVAAWWDRLDANRERRERYHEILRNDEDIPFEYGAAADAHCFPDSLNSMLERQNRKGYFEDVIFCCPYDIHELVTDEYISDILRELNEDQKFLLFLFAVRQYRSAKIAAIRGQTDRNVRKVRASMLKKIQKKLLSALEEKIRQQQPLTINEKNFLKKNGIRVDKKHK